MDNLKAYEIVHTASRRLPADGETHDAINAALAVIRDSLGLVVNSEGTVVVQEKKIKK